MALPNIPENAAWDPKDMNKEIPVMGISIGDFSEEFFSEIEESYSLNTNTLKLVLSALEP